MSSLFERPIPSASSLTLRLSATRKIRIRRTIGNCLVPAKLGDLYRAYLLKINSSVSLSKTFGTVFIERILDLFAIAILGLAAGFWRFRSGLPPEMQFVVALGVGTVVVLAALLFTLRNFGRRIIYRLPLPHRVVELYDRFEEGVFQGVG